MNPKDIFGLLVRMLGLLSGAYGCYDFLFAIMESAGFTTTTHNPPAMHAVWGFLWVVIAIIIIKSADKITSFAYDKDKSKSD